MNNNALYGVLFDSRLVRERCGYIELVRYLQLLLRRKVHPPHRYPGKSEGRPAMVGELGNSTEMREA